MVRVSSMASCGNGKATQKQTENAEKALATYIWNLSENLYLVGGCPQHTPTQGLLEVSLQGLDRRHESPSLEQDPWDIELLGDPRFPQRVCSENF
jgi:hypothetical protein